MTIQEFSDEFDVLLNSFSGTAGDIRLDEYEKSIYLTEAQEGTIKTLYSGTGPTGKSFEETEELRRYLSDLVLTYVTDEKLEGKTGISSNSVFFKLPDDLWYITYEAVNFNKEEMGCKSSEGIQVVPTTQDEYHRIKKNPFRGANDRKVLRFDIENNTVEIITTHQIEEYLVRYLAKPEPIILVDLPENLSIDNQTSQNECKLHSALHRLILQNAVLKAAASMGVKTSGSESDNN